MPRKYVRREGVRPRAEWTEEDLKCAFEEMKQNKYSYNEISRRYGIPYRTLKRRFIKQDTKKNTLGKHPILGFDNEKRLVAIVQELQAEGLSITGAMLRKLAFEFAEKLGIEHNFHKESREAGRQWLQSFLERNPQIKPVSTNVRNVDYAQERILGI